MRGRRERVRVGGVIEAIAFACGAPESAEFAGNVGHVAPCIRAPFLRDNVGVQWKARTVTHRCRGFKRPSTNGGLHFELLDDAVRVVVKTRKCHGGAAS